ncbi:30S ribosomal protein S9 [Corynebacterium sphenisci DSM 44792]|uniref:Small ribosomal subunit protein uS9 n=1 Tax=Corynebacterium sphenisci DSM 44792 TaxID=1437874 RepID=A0A1L7CW63_9CORY|nr:30S ribosomal protein S9 [Corynebacterium sphenisci]APT90032.1 30S ribosomal protein S9 [Corynebacterium sphenisci DSM 44792]
MTNPENTENQVEAGEATFDDVQAAAASATEGFTATIGDVVAEEAPAEEAVVEVQPATLENPIQTVGRRKRAVARVILTAGTGKIECNGRELEDYFPNKLHQQEIKDPLVLVERQDQFDIRARIHGGGPSGQAGALRLAIARALNEYNPEERGVLKKAGFLTRDARAVERKKAGLHKARRAPQYSKR